LQLSFYLLLKQKKMKITLQRESLLQPLMGLSDSNKKWIADRLYESIRQEHSMIAGIDKAIILKGIKEGLEDVREGHTFPAEDLFKHLNDDTD